MMTGGNNYFSYFFELNLGRLPKVLCKVPLGCKNIYNTFHTKLQFCSPMQSYPVTDEKKTGQKQVTKNYEELH